MNDFGEPTDGVATEFMAFPLQEMSNETSAETTRLEPEKGQDLGKEADMEVEEEDREQPEAPAADNGGVRLTFYFIFFCLACEY